jgi:hypothetical protein
VATLRGPVVTAYPSSTRAACSSAALRLAALPHDPQTHIRAMILAELYRHAV